MRPSTAPERASRSSEVSTSLLGTIARWRSDPPRVPDRAYTLLTIRPQSVTVADWALGDSLDAAAGIIIALSPRLTAKAIAEYLVRCAVDIHIAAAAMTVDNRQRVYLTSEGARAVARLRATKEGA